jgi:hypothetical protein
MMRKKTLFFCYLFLYFLLYFLFYFFIFLLFLHLTRILRAEEGKRKKRTLLKLCGIVCRVVDVCGDREYLVIGDDDDHSAIEKNINRKKN